MQAAATEAEVKATAETFLTLKGAMHPDLQVAHVEHHLTESC